MDTWGRGTTGQIDQWVTSLSQQHRLYWSNDSQELTGGSCQQQQQRCRVHGLCWSWTGGSCSSLLSRTQKVVLGRSDTERFLYKEEGEIEKGRGARWNLHRERLYTVYESNGNISKLKCIYLITVQAIYTLCCPCQKSDLYLEIMLGRSVIKWTLHCANIFCIMTQECSWVYVV